MHSNPASPWASLALALVVPLASVPVHAQEAPVFGTGVTVVAVPAFVTDKAGKAVAGLTAADFEIEDQGKKARVVALQEVDVTSPVPAAGAGALIQAAARRQFLLLFDLSFSSPTGIMRARDAAIAFVRESLAPSDLAAAATYGQSGVRILVGFSSDREQLARAIESLGVLETQRLRDPLQIAYELGAPLEGPGIGSRPPENPRQAEMLEHLRTQTQQLNRGEQALYRQRVDAFLGGLDQLARMLDSVQGRKQVILLSAGFDSTVLGGAQGQEATEASQASVQGRLWEVQSDRYFGDASARQKLDDLFQSLAASDTVIHSVDVTGLAAGGQVDEAVPGWRPGQGRDTLAQFAANSGGRFVKDANNLGTGLAEVLDASSHYYVLAFEPVDPGSKRDRLRKLKVRVLRPGLEVSHRRGYVLPGPKREVDPAARQLQAAEAIAKGLSGGPITLRAVAVPYRSARGRVSLPVVLEIDGRALLGGGSSKELKLEVYGYALGAEGRIHDAVGLSPAINLAEAKPALEAEGLQVLTAFAVPPGPVDLRFLVRDTASGRAGSLQMSLEMPAFGAGQLVLSPPLAMDDPRTRLVLPSASRALPSLEIPFRLEDAPFTAEPLPTLHNGAVREVCVIVWSGAPQYGTTAGLEVEAELLDAAGAAHRLTLEGAPRVVADADGQLRYVLRLVPRGVPAGRYSLRMAFRNPATNVSASSQSAVQVQ
jgi:VWFA-related protein